MPNEQPSTAYAQVNRQKSRNRHQNFVVPEGIRRDVLAKTDGFQITYYEQSRDSDKVLVTFDGIGSDISDSGFGTKFALAHGYNHVFVAQRIRSQYQELSIEQFYDAVHNLIGSREVFTYGSSLGGYCALYYGGCIDATIVAAAPKNSALPEFLKPEFEDLEFRHLPLSQVPKSSKDPVILYDPFRKVDDKMVKQFVLPIYPNARIVELPFAGHNVLTPMLKAGVLKQFMLDVFDHGIVGQASLDSEHIHTWHIERAKHLASSGRPLEACAALRTSLSLKPSEKAYRLLVRALIQAKDLPEARECVAKGLELFPSEPALRELAGRLAARQQQPFVERLLRRLRLGGSR